MSTAITTRRPALRRRVGSAVTAVGLMLGLSVAGVMAASPAQASCKYSYLSVGSAYAEAYAETADCSWQSRSYARHGSLVSGWTAWATASSHAFADQGTATSAYAENQFR